MGPVISMSSGARLSLVSRKYVAHTIAFAATLLAVFLDSRWAGPLLSVGIVVFIVVLLSMAGRIFHPTSAIRDSDSLVIKGAVLVIVLLMMVASVQITRLFAARRCLPESAA